MSFYEETEQRMAQGWECRRGEEYGVALRHTSELCLAVADRIIREL